MERGSMSVYSDAAKRCSDNVNLGLLLGYIGRWVAIRLSDGGSDGNYYDTRADAIRHQIHETLCCYIKILPNGMPIEDAEKFMAIYRKLYDDGFRLTDPEDPRHIIMPYTKEELNRFLKK